nr:bifunctional 4-hydroxy-2-oxoglutarate aldolase/2-dehydro-3-deoxy-phosphogluconate aldolase [Nocardioides luti]
MGRDRFLPVAVLDTPGDAVPLVEGLAAGGLGLVEVTLRSAAGLPGLALVAGRTDVLVGAGTVLTVAQVDAVVAAGAAYVVTPGFSPAVVERCLELGVPVLPGVATPGEVMAALALGLDTVKLFPARELGGPAMVDALRGPFPGLRVVPSGGITRDVAPDYLRRPGVLAVSGSWVTPRGPVSAEAVRQAARATVAHLSAGVDA